MVATTRTESDHFRGVPRNWGALRSRAAIDGLIAAIVIFSIACCADWSLWRAAERSALSHTQADLSRLAAVAATAIDVELHERIMRDPSLQNTEEYRRAVEPLRRMMLAASDVTYVYTAVRDGDKVRFVLDAAEPGDHDGDGREDQAQIWEEYVDPEPIIYEALGDGFSAGRRVASQRPYSDAWGTFITGYAPIHDASGEQVGVVGVDMAADDYMRDRAVRSQAAMWGLLPAFFFSLLAGYGVAALRRRQLRAVAELEDERHHASRLADVARRTQNAVVVTDALGRIEWINEGFTRITGYTLGEVRGRKAGDFLQGPDSDPTEVRRMSEAIHAAKPIDVELINYTKDGRAYWIRIEIEPVRDSSGALTGFMAIESDITARRETENALREFKERLEIATDAGSIGIWDYDLVSGSLTWDQRMHSLYGIGPDEFTGHLRSWESVVVPEDAARVMADLHAAIEQRADFQAEFRILRSGGELRHIQANAKVIRAADGSPMRVVGVNFDITERKLATEAIRRSEERFRVFVEQSPSAVLMLDREMRHLAASRRWLDEIKANCDDIIGRHHYDVYPDLKEEWKAVHARCLAGATERCSEDCFVRQDGTLRWTSWEVAPWRDSKGQIGGIMIFSADLTEKKPEEDFLRQASRVAKVGAWELDLTTTTPRWSPMIREIYEVEPDYTPSLESSLEFYPPHERARVQTAVQRSIETGEGFDLECELITAKGRHRWVRSIGEAVMIQGRCVRLSGALFDITDRKNAEIRLRESEERYSLVLDGTDDAIWDWDLVTDTVYYSPRMRRYLGLDDVDEFAEPALWLARIDPRQRAQFETDLTLHIEGATEALHTELRLTGAGESRRWTLCRARAVRDESGKAVRLVGALTDISELKTAQERLRQLTLHDRLTGLPNRVFLTERLRQAVSRVRQDGTKTFSVLFFDFDRFKMINDALGHAVGDQLLIAIAQRFRESLRSCDVAARFGGDEFVVMLDGSDEAEALAIAERLVGVFAAAHDLDGHEVVSTASVGIATWGGGYAAAEDLLRDADAALQIAKALGKNRVQAFDATMRQRLMRRHEVETLLRTMEPGDELDVVYQPVVSLESGEVVGFEALVRWPKAPLGEIAPDEFIPVAEETGDIVRLGEWVLRRACETLRAWTDELGGARRPWISVNLSKRQLSQPDLLETIQAVLRDTRVPASSLKLEITESTIMDPRHDHIETMRRIRALGVGLSMDDFGTGYSSLSCLQRFPIETLKIDRGFVVNLTTQRQFAAVMQSIVMLAHHLDLSIVAEGVETHEQVTQLQSIGCGYAQGYYFARPLHADRALAMLREGDGSRAAA